jgi:hypothetical protein
MRKRKRQEHSGIVEIKNLAIIQVGKLDIDLERNEHDSFSC